MNLIYFTWNPEWGKLDLGVFELRLYSFMFLLAFLCGYKIFEYIYKKEHVSLKLLDPLLLYSIIGCLLGARLGHVLFYQTELIQDDPLSIFLPFQFTPEFKFTGFAGLASHGAIFGFIIALYLYNRKYLKRNFLWLLDRYTIPVALGGFFVRMGNFFNSEIVGKEAYVSWAVNFLDNDYGPEVPRHPTQLYEGISYLILFFIMTSIYLKTNKRLFLGWMFGFFFTVLWSVRFIVEFWKEAQGEEELSNMLNLGLNNGQILSIPFILIGLYFIFSAKREPLSYELPLKYTADKD